jgi:hypothetical protein
MNGSTPGTDEHDHTAAETPSSAAEPATVTAPAAQHPAQPADPDAVSALQRLIHLIHKLVHELRHDTGHAISLVALHVVALGILEKTPLLALLTLR